MSLKETISAYMKNAEILAIDRLSVAK